VQIVPDVKALMLQSIIRGHADIESVIHTDGWTSYDELVDLSYEKHFRVNHSENEFSSGDVNHINSIESFWSFAKGRLAKFRGVRPVNFELHLRETEFRFNNRDRNLCRLLPKMLRENPL
jgi:transposase-like protein